MDPAEVSERELRALGLLQVALGAGPVLLWVVVAVMAGATPAAPEAAAPETLRLLGALTAVHAVMAPLHWGLATVLFRRALAGGWADFAARLRGATILRLAMVEAPALLGGVVGLIAAQAGALAAAPWVWLNVLSTFVLLALVVTTFPTRERVSRLARAAR